ncbi:hypothetical protein AVEN_225926-1 [Araneus ventricosus]|uniref:RNase H type-1 domain-containing protein n=1 Tax=Araneus ventricosus TaxID=182803 RepID=A0A4Y2BBI9_ARAVE|nr:hypothetical protein AVEN_225926-1 [Araneus ventricosus]
MLCWVPSHVGILGNEQADRAAKSADVPISISIPVGDLRKHVEMFLHTKWQEQWDLETDNKLHTLKPLVQPWPSLVTETQILLVLVYPSSLVVWRGTTNVFELQLSDVSPPYSF